MRVLVTGSAGFIGYHTARRLLQRGDEVVGIDNVNDYYAPSLKEDRLRELQATASLTGSSYEFLRADLADRAAVESLFASRRFDRVVHLAAQAGVRHSEANPYAYIDSNLLGFANLLEASRRQPVGHFTFASSSSVYGLNTTTPFSEHHIADHPTSLYAATKRSGELMAHAYSHLYNLPATGLRFFTVYGPWGRPDMAYFKFTKAILEGRPIEVFDHGNMVRDFTFVDDVVEALIRVSDRPARPDPAWNAGNPDPAISSGPFRIYNIGNSSPVRLTRLIDILESCLERRAEIVYKPAHRGEVSTTAADVEDLARDAGFAPGTPLESGLRTFANWLRGYYKL